MVPEIQHYLDMINSLRAEVAAAIENLPVEALNWRPIEPREAEDHVTNSLAVMAAHVAGAERHWINEMVGRQPALRHRPTEFKTVAEDSPFLLAELEKTGRQTELVLNALTPDDLDGSREIHDRSFTVRWCILHAIEHTALHLGHMQITRQLWTHQLKSPAV